MCVCQPRPAKYILLLVTRLALHTTIFALRAFVFVCVGACVSSAGMLSVSLSVNVCVCVQMCLCLCLCSCLCLCPRSRAFVAAASHQHSHVPDTVRYLFVSTRRSPIVAFSAVGLERCLHFCSSVVDGPDS